MGRRADATRTVGGRRRARRVQALAVVVGAAAVLAAACGPASPPGPTAGSPVTLATPVTAPAGGTLLAPGTPDPYAASGLGEFVARCPLSHRARHDPIVSPGNPSFWHEHDFFGNREVDHLSTVASLQGRPTTCDPIADAAAYWMPTLLRDGVPVDPSAITVYYLVKRPQDPAKVQPFPQGLRMVAGNARAMSPQPDHVVQWHCIGAPSSTSTIGDCGGAELELILQFPDCWDGRSLDSADHTSHLTYSRGRSCPASHPVLVPQLEFRFRWPVSGPGVTVSSDLHSHGGVPTATAPGLTAHGDFINTWDQAELERRVLTCLRAARICNAAGTVIR